MTKPASDTEALLRLVGAAEMMATHLAAATGAVANRFVTSTDMKVGAYSVANSGAMPSEGARKVTVTVAANDADDTMGSLTVTGTNLAGAVISEVLTPVAGSTVTGTKWFKTVTSVVGAGWVIDGTGAVADSITVGCAAGIIAIEGDGVLGAVAVNAAAAGAVTLADSVHTLAILKSSIAEGNYRFDVAFTGYLSVSAAAATDITVIAKGL